MKKMMIYPYSNAYEPYALHSKLMENIKVASLVASSGSGIVGKSIAIDDGKLVVSSDFDEELGKCDVIWFVEDEKYELSANSHFLRPAGPHFPASQGHIKRSALEIGRARGAPPC